jgi:hypothetical protein
MPACVVEEKLQEIIAEVSNLSRRPGTLNKWQVNCISIIQFWIFFRSYSKRNHGFGKAGKF